MALKINDETSAALETIRAYARDIDETKANIKSMREQAKEIKEGKGAFAEVERLSEELKAAKEKLRVSLLSDGDYNDLLENIGQETEKLRDQEDILSSHIAFYWKSTDERQVPMNDQTGDARDIVIKAKLGAEGKYQTSLLAGGAGDQS